MSSAARSVFLVVAGLAALAACRRASAQEPPDPGAAVDCFVAAYDDVGIETSKAVRLCAGAASATPARCYELAEDELGLSDEEIVRLCARATSDAPVACVARLDAETVLDSSELVEYCTPPGLPVRSGASLPECLEAALDDAAISDAEAVDLCRGAPDAGPVACYLRGDAETGLDSANLVALCAPVQWLDVARP